MVCHSFSAKGMIARLDPVSIFKILKIPHSVQQKKVRRPLRYVISALRQPVFGCFFYIFIIPHHKLLNMFLLILS